MPGIVVGGVMPACSVASGIVGLKGGPCIKPGDVDAMACKSSWHKITAIATIARLLCRGIRNHIAPLYQRVKQLLSRACRIDETSLFTTDITITSKVEYTLSEMNILMVFY